MAYSRTITETEDEDDFDLDNPLEENVQETAPPEEKTFAKRYGDLRRYSALQLAKKDQENADLRRQLEEGTKGHLRLPDPNDEKATDEWIAEYPDLSKIVARLAARQAEQAIREVKAKVDQLENSRKELTKLTAQEQLARVHPDFFDDIRLDPKFGDWLATKSKMMYNALYVNEDDWQAAADVISLYKSETGKSTKQRDNSRDTIREVRPRRNSTTPTTSNEYSFTESQIAVMSADEYERNEEAINDAMRKGRVLRDMSAGLR